MAVPSFGELWKLAKTVDDLLSMEQRNSAAFTEIARRLDKIELRLNQVESDRNRMITEAKAAASVAASVAATAHLTGLAQALGGLEERVRQLAAPGSAKNKRKLPKT